MKKWLAALTALIVTVPGAASAQRGKPLVAIYKIEDVAKTGQADSFSAMIETSITTTNKFRVMERQHIGRLVGEQAGAKAGLLTTNTPGKVGGFGGADFLIYGTITSVSSVRKANMGSTFLAGMLSRGNSGPTCSNALATLGVDIKITDARTGEVRYATRIDETQRSATACGDNAQIDVNALLRSAADKVATGLVTAIYPIQVAAIDGDGQLVLNYGQGTLLAGTVLAVYAKGAEIRDPATGEVISNSETKLGFVRVVEVQSRVSKATPLAPFATAPQVGAILRPATTTDLQVLAKPQKRK